MLTKKPTKEEIKQATETNMSDVSVSVWNKASETNGLEVIDTSLFIIGDLVKTKNDEIIIIHDIHTSTIDCCTRGDLGSIESNNNRIFDKLVIIGNTETYPFGM